jgi:hypothetical protein
LFVAYVVADIATIAGFNLSFVGNAYDVLSMIKSELLCSCLLCFVACLTFGEMLVCIIFLNNLNFGGKYCLEQLSVTAVSTTSNGCADVSCLSLLAAQ